MQKASARLAKGTAVYMAGNLISRVLQMLILPLITAVLATEEYGDYDLIIASISLVMPIITMQMIEGMFRNMYEADEAGRRTTVSTVTAFLLGGCGLLAVVLTTVKLVYPALQYPVLIFANYLTAILFNYMQKLARCDGKNRQFAISGVLNTIIMLGCQAITLMVLHMRVDGMLIAHCAAYLGGSAYLALRVKPWRWIRREAVSKKACGELLKFSAPLVPNSICWWLVATSDKYVIAGTLGSSANGIYAIAGKFSQLLTFATSVFQLAWQESAIMEADSEARDRFYTQTFNRYMRLLLGGYVLMLPLIRLLMVFLLSQSYQAGYLYNPILLFGAVFQAFSGFYGSAYLVFRKTGGALITTIVAAVVNIAIGWGLIGRIGLFAPALGTSAAFLVQWLMRSWQMREFFHVKIDWKAFAGLIACAAAAIFCYYQKSLVLQGVVLVLAAAIFVLFNRELIRAVAGKLLHKGGARQA